MSAMHLSPRFHIRAQHAGALDGQPILWWSICLGVVSSSLRRKIKTMRHLELRHKRGAAPLGDTYNYGRFCAGTA